MEKIEPEALLAAYRKGKFPMAESKDDTTIKWHHPRRRGIIPIQNFRVSSNVRRIIRQGRYTCKVDTCFRQVLEACADRETTWISDFIIDSYEELHLAGHAHSVEMFDKKDNLVGGLYGITLGSVYFGESMFKRAKEADKVALWYCHKIIEENEFELWDTQFYTKHLVQFGCKRIWRWTFNRMLKEALKKENRPFVLPTSAENVAKATR